MRSTVGVIPSKEFTSIELTGSDRPGLLSELSAVLADLSCNVVNAEIWIHNARAAAVIHVTDQTTRQAIEHPKRLLIIKELLFTVMKGNGTDFRIPRMSVSSSRIIHRGRRLHQMLFADRDSSFRRRGWPGPIEPSFETSMSFEWPKDVEFKISKPQVTVLDCSDGDYTVVTIRSLDRPKLLFDSICSLTDVEYVVFHEIRTGVIVCISKSNETKHFSQEYYIRLVDGFPISSEAEQERVVECLEAAIERRASRGRGIGTLLSDITRTFRENGLCIRRAEISTQGGKAKDTFFVTDVSGNPVDPKTVDLIQDQIGQANLQVKGNSFYLRDFPRRHGEISFLGTFLKDEVSKTLNSSNLSHNFCSLLVFGREHS